MKLNSCITKLLFCLATTLVLTGCNKGKGFKTQSGLIFYVYNDHSADSSARTGNVLKLNVKEYLNDSLVSSTYDGLPKYEHVMPGLFYPYEAAEIYPFFHTGDSIVLIQEADSLLRRRMFYTVPDYLAPGDKIVTHFKVIDIFENDSIANLDMSKEYPKAIERNRSGGAARIKSYLDLHNIEAILTPDTVYIETVTEGAGETVKANDNIRIRFTAKTLSGTVFGSNFGPDDAPMDYEIMSGFMPIGIEEGLTHLRVGDHARLYIPAMKAFGASPPPGLEEGFQDIIFEVEILSKKRKEEEEEEEEEEVQ